MLPVSNLTHKYLIKAKSGQQSLCNQSRAFVKILKRQGQKLGSTINQQYVKDTESATRSCYELLVAMMS